MSTRIDFSRVIKTLEGDAMLRPLGPKESDGTAPTILGYLCAEALLNPGLSKDKDATEKLRYHELAVKIYKGGLHSIGNADLKVLKDFVNKAYGPLIVAQAYDAFDSGEKLKEEVEE